MGKEVDLRPLRCSFCGCEVAVCRGCERRQRYCSRACATRARRIKLREYARKYRQTPRGRALNAQRQARWRRRKAAQRVASVTHHRSAASVRQSEGARGHAQQRGGISAPSLLRQQQSFVSACHFCRSSERSVAEWLLVAGEWILSRLRESVRTALGATIRRGERRGSGAGLEDIVQDAVASLLARSTGGRPRCDIDSVCASLFVHARNPCQNAWRKARRRQFLGFLA